MSGSEVNINEDISQTELQKFFDEHGVPRNPNFDRMVILLVIIIIFGLIILTS